MATDQHIAAHQEAIDVLKIHNAVTSLARRYDPKLVMRVLRGWLEFMDKVTEPNDDSDPPSASVGGSGPPATGPANAGLVQPEGLRLDDGKDRV